MSVTVLVPIADGTEEMEAVTIIDVLRRAGADLVVAGIESKTISASRGVGLVADTRLSECTATSYDLIVLPGGIPGAQHLRDSVELAGILKQQSAAGKMIGAICAAPEVVLAHHNIIGRRRVTGHPGFTAGLANKSALAERVVVDGNIVTSRGAGTALEFSLKLVELLFGRTKALEVAEAMVAAPGIV